MYAQNFLIIIINWYIVTTIFNNVPKLKNLCYKNKVNRTTEDQLFYSSNHHKLLHYQIIGGKTVKNVQIDPQTTKI